jgi:four helix bundle suffix protein
MRNEETPWSAKSEEHKTVSKIPLDRPTYKDDVQHLSCVHILKQKHKFDDWLSSNNSMTEANCLLILCNRLIMMLSKQIENQLETFKEEGGFTEALSAERLAHKVEQSIQTDAPNCPKCGKPMIKRMAKKGKNAGNAFWSCSGFPNCDGTRSI